MALTFAQSTQQQKTQSEITTMSLIPENPVVVLSNEIENDDTNWTLDDRKYKYYYEYSDDNVCVVDKYKNITLNEQQMSISQEQNSQVIPFRMYRYYDGYDLSTARLVIFYQNKNGQTDYSTPINVYYNDKYIRFFWLLDANATQVVGELKFEIQAHGTNSKGDNYVWKSLINKELSVIQSLIYRTLDDAEIDWANSIFVEMQQVLDTSKQHLNQTAELEKKALSYSNLAATSALSAENAAQRSKEYYEQLVETGEGISAQIDSINLKLSIHKDECAASIREVRQDFAQADSELHQQVSDETDSKINILQKQVMNTYLPLDGTKSMINDLQVQNGFVGLTGNTDCAILETYQTQNKNDGKRKLVLRNENQDLEVALQISDNTSTYNVYHEANKPTAVDVGALPDTTTAEDIGAAPLDHTHNDSDYGGFDVDCGYFLEDYDYGYFTDYEDTDNDGDGGNDDSDDELQQVAVHNETELIHEYMIVDGNDYNSNSVSVQSVYTLEEHLNDVYAHQNIIIDGNIEK